MDKGKSLPKATAKERQRIAYLTGILNKNGKWNTCTTKNNILKLYSFEIKGQGTGTEKFTFFLFPILRLHVPPFLKYPILYIKKF